MKPIFLSLLVACVFMACKQPRNIIELPPAAPPPHKVTLIDPNAPATQETAPDQYSINSESIDGEESFGPATDDTPVQTVKYGMAEYPGGQDSLITFLARNLKYPEYAKEAGIQGTVYLQLTTDNTGKIIEIVVLRGVHPSLDQEAKRVARLMPALKPTDVFGVQEKYQCNLPIKFLLQ